MKPGTLFSVPPAFSIRFGNASSICTIALRPRKPIFIGCAFSSVGTGESPVWDADHRANQGSVETPHAFDRKYPKLGQSWGGWFWFFPLPAFSVDPHSGVERRHHLFEEWLQRAIKKATASAGIFKPVSVHTMRYSVATHLLQAGHRYSNRAGTIGAFGCVDDHDLHTRTQGGRGRHRQPAGCNGLTLNRPPS